MSKFTYLDTDAIINAVKLDQSVSRDFSVLSNLDTTGGRLLVTETVRGELRGGSPARDWVERGVSSGAITVRDTRDIGIFEGSDAGERSIAAAEGGAENTALPPAWMLSDHPQTFIHRPPA